MSLRKGGCLFKVNSDAVMALNNGDIIEYDEEMSSEMGSGVEKLYKKP